MQYPPYLVPFACDDLAFQLWWATVRKDAVVHIKYRIIYSTIFNTKYRISTCLHTSHFTLQWSKRNMLYILALHYWPQLLTMANVFPPVGLLVFFSHYNSKPCTEIDGTNLILLFLRSANNTWQKFIDIHPQRSPHQGFIFCLPVI